MSFFSDALKKANVQWKIANAQICPLWCVKSNFALKNTLIVIFLKLVYRLWNAHKGQQVLVSLISCEQPNIGATIRIGREIRCLPYAFFLVAFFALCK